MNPIARPSGRPWPRTWAVGIASALVAAIGWAHADGALGATITVTTTLDKAAADEHCSLREAVDAANHDSTGPGGDCTQGSGTDTIALASGHYTLTIGGIEEDADATGDLDILSDLSIVGAGAGDTTIDGNHIDRVLEVMPGRIVSIRGVTIEGGRAPDGAPGSDVTGSSPGGNGDGSSGQPGASGGGIFNNGGNLTIVDSVISENVAGNGGDGGSGHGAEGSSSGSTGGNGGGGTGGAGGEGGNGGGIFTTGTLSLTRVTVTANRAGAGGMGGEGIGGAGGTVLSPGHGGNGGSGLGGSGGNGGYGGGIAEASGGELTVDESTISQDTSGAGGAANSGVGGVGGGVGTGGAGGYAIGGIGGTGGGGGGISTSDPAVITRSLISGNEAGRGGDTSGATGGAGGVAIGTAGDGGEADAGIAGSGGSGGGLWMPSGTVFDVTLDGNHTGAGGGTGVSRGGNGGASTSGAGGKGGRASGGIGGEGGLGGGLAIPSGAEVAWTVRNATIDSNLVGIGGSIGAITGGQGGAGSPPGSAGAGEVGIPGGDGTAGAAFDFSFSPAATLGLENTIVAGNGTPGCGATAAAVIDGGHDISFGDPTCPGANVDPLLGALTDNGGPTLTRALLPGSPAIDSVPASGAGCPPTDQRGVLRPNGPACDAGAYEHAPPTVTTGEATGVSAGAATLRGQLNPNARATEYHFELGTTSSYSTATPSVDQAAGVTAVAVSAAVGGLLPGTTYHYRLVATNGDGTARGQDGTFTTRALPEPPLPRVAPPNTRIKRAKIDQAKRSAAFRFTAAGNVTGFQCLLKRPGHRAKGFRKCGSPKAYRHLKPGRYRFAVRAVGPGGTDPSPAKKLFDIRP